MPVTAAPLYTLYVGNRDFLPFSAAEETGIIAIVGQRFPSFTILPGRGFFEGRELPTLLIQIASHQRDAVLATCNDLGRALDQRWIGLSETGIYTSVLINFTQTPPNLNTSVTDREAQIARAGNE